MNWLPVGASDGLTPRNLAALAIRAAATLKVALALLAALAIALVAATLVEASHSREHARWYIYGSSWFAALLGLLAVNILAAAGVRYPWRRHHVGFLIAHAGLLLLLLGVFQTLSGGIAGQMLLEQGADGDRIILPDRSQFAIRWQGLSEREDRKPAVFTFRPGPIAWSTGKSLDLGEVSGVHLKLLEFLDHAKSDETWIADETARGSPALKIALMSSAGKPIAEPWLVANPLGAPLELKPMRFQLRQAPLDSMLEDFLHPPASGMDQHGVLSIHYAGQMRRISVGENIGKTIELGDSGATVELVEYLPNARPAQGGQFVSDGDAPDNPLLVLRVGLPHEKEPLRQIAFAKLPLLNLDGIRGSTCPIQFWYHHPAVSAEPGAEFLQTSDGQLHARIGAGGKYQSRGTVARGDLLELAAGFRGKVIEHFPHARLAVAFQAVEAPAGQSDSPDAAALLEVTVAGETHEIWLKHNDAKYGMRSLATSEGPLAIAFGYEKVPLGFSLRLLQLDRDASSGGTGEASLSSSVRLVDRSRDVDQVCEISTNRPLVHDRYTFHQLGVQDLPNGNRVSVLTVTHDPGQFMKYAGGLMLCAGTLIVFCRRAYASRRQAGNLPMTVIAESELPADEVVRPAHAA